MIYHHHHHQNNNNNMATMAQQQQGGGLDPAPITTTSSSTARINLHNFSLPPRLSWGTQRLLRCSKSSPPPPSSTSESSKRPRRTPSPNTTTTADLMFDFRSSEVDNMRAPPPFFSAPPTPPPALDSRPWNLRTRRAASSPVRINEEPPPPIRNEEAEVVERARFSVALSRHEIEEDFLEIAGRRPPRKPKKRPRFIQKQLDSVFPGVWLSEITPDMYKVNLIPEPPK